MFYVCSIKLHTEAKAIIIIIYFVGIMFYSVHMCPKNLNEWYIFYMYLKTVSKPVTHNLPLLNPTKILPKSKKFRPDYRQAQKFIFFILTLQNSIKIIVISLIILASSLQNSYILWDQHVLINQHHNNRNIGSVFGKRMLFRKETSFFQKFGKKYAYWNLLPPA